MFGEGFGTCCQYVLTECGSTASENGTVIQNGEFPSPRTSEGRCQFIIAKVEDVCFVRVDFDRLEVAPPETVAANSGECRIDNVVFQ